MEPLFNCILIDLTVFDEFEDIKIFLTACNLEDKICPRKLWAMKHGCYLAKEDIYKVWYDGTTFQPIGYSTRKEQNFNKSFIDFLINMKPIEPTSQGIIEEISTLVEDSSDIEIELTIDNILDKIKLQGIGSLTDREKEFLASK